MSQPTTPPTATQSAARTDDLLASGAEPEDGAQGFDRDANPETFADWNGRHRQHDRREASGTYRK